MLSRTLALIAFSFSAFAQPRPAEVIPGRFLVEFEGEPVATFRRSAEKASPARAAEMITQHRDALRSRQAEAKATLAARGIKEPVDT